MFDSNTLGVVLELLCHLELVPPWGTRVLGVPFWEAPQLCRLVPCMFVNKAWKDEVYRIRRLVRRGQKLCFYYDDINELLQTQGKEAAMKTIQTDPRWNIDNLKVATELKYMTNPDSIPPGCSFQYLQWWLEVFPKTKLRWDQIFSVGGLEVYRWAVAKGVIGKYRVSDHSSTRDMLPSAAAYNRLDVLEDDTFMCQCTSEMSIIDFGIAVKGALEHKNEEMAEKVLELYLYLFADTPASLAIVVFNSQKNIYGTLGKTTQETVVWLGQRQQIYLEAQRDKRKVEALLRDCVYTQSKNG